MIKPKIGNVEKLAAAAKIAKRKEQLLVLLDVQEVTASEFRKSGREEAADDIEKNIEDLKKLIAQQEEMVRAIEADATKKGKK